MRYHDAVSNYRDDRDALRARTEALERELAQKNREIEEIKGSDHARERLAQIERDLAAANAAVAELKRQTAASDAPRGRLAVVVAVPLALVMMGAAAGAFVLTRGSSPPHAKVVATPSPPPVDLPATPNVAEPTPAPSTAAADPPRRVRATWRGKASKVTGLAIAQGAACTVNADLAGAGTSIRPERVVVACGEKKLYDSADPLDGMSHLSHGARQVRGSKRGQVRFALLWDDKGERAPTRSQASVNSLSRSASVWSTSTPPFHVDLALEERSADDVEPLLAEETGATCRAHTAAGVVAEVTGDAPVKKGQPCQVKFGPGMQNDECRIDARCGGVELYGPGPAGGAGYVKIVDGKALSDDKPTSGDNDPMLSWPLGSDAFVVTDEGARTYRVQVRLSPPPDVLEK
jgi:hypothetical protein